MAPLTEDEKATLQAKRAGQLEATQTQPAPTGGLDMALLEKPKPTAGDGEIEDGSAPTDSEEGELVPTVEEYGLVNFACDLRGALVGFGMCAVVLVLSLGLGGAGQTYIEGSGSPGRCLLEGGALPKNGSQAVLFARHGKLSVDALLDHCQATCAQETSSIHGCQLVWTPVPRDAYWQLEDTIYRDAVNFSITEEDCPGFGCSADGLCATGWANQDNENQTCSVHCIFRVVTNVPISESSQHGGCTTMSDGETYPKMFSTGDTFSGEEVRWSANAKHCGESSGFHMCMAPDDEVSAFTCTTTPAAIAGGDGAAVTDGAGAHCWKAVPPSPAGYLPAFFGVCVGIAGAALFCWEIFRLVGESTATRASSRGLEAYSGAITLPNQLVAPVEKFVGEFQTRVVPRVEAAAKWFQKLGISAVYLVVVISIVLTTSSGLIREDNPDTRSSPVFIIMLGIFFRVVLISLAIIMMNCSRREELHGTELGFLPPIVLLIIKGGAAEMFGSSALSNLGFLLLLVAVLMEVLPRKLHWGGIASIGSYSLIALRLFLTAVHPDGWGITFVNGYTWLVTGMAPSLWMAIGLYALETCTIFELRRWSPPRKAASAEGVRMHSAFVVACSIGASVYTHCSSEGGFASANATIFFWVAVLVSLRHMILANGEVASAKRVENSLAADQDRPEVHQAVDSLVHEFGSASLSGKATLLAKLWEALGRWRWRLGIMMVMGFFNFVALSHALLGGSLTDDEKTLAFTPHAAACTGMVLSVVMILCITSMLLVDAGYPGFYIDEGFRLIMCLDVFTTMLNLIVLLKVSGPLMVPLDVHCDATGDHCPLEDMGDCLALASSWCPEGKLVFPTCSDPVSNLSDGTHQLRCPDGCMTFVRLLLVISSLLSNVASACVMAVECQPATAAAHRQAVLRKAVAHEIDQSTLGKKLFAVFTRMWNYALELDWSRITYFVLWVVSRLGYLSLLAGAVIGGAGSLLGMKRVGESEVSDVDSCSRLLFLTFGFAMVSVLLNEFARVEEPEETPEQKLNDKIGQGPGHVPQQEKPSTYSADGLRSVAGASGIFAFSGVLILFMSGFSSTGMGWAVATGTVSLAVACVASMVISF